MQNCRPAIECLEPRKLLAATPAPITNFLGVYVGSISFTNGDTQTATLSVTSQKKRSFSGSLVEGDGSTAVFKGTVAKKGASRITYHSTNAKPKFSGIADIGLNISGDALTGIFQPRTGKVKVNGGFVGIRQPSTNP